MELQTDMHHLPINEVRAAFPYLDECIYLNTASAGVAWPGQAAAVTELYHKDHGAGYNGLERWRARADAARGELTQLLAVPKRSIHFLHSTTEALNLVALSLPMTRGDQVVVAADEFPSVVLPWRTLKSRGIEVIEVPIPAEAERTASLVAAVGPRTRVITASHVHWRTGTRLDLKRLAAAKQSTGCRLIVDGAHAVGAVPVEAAQVDAYCAPTFKWLLSGFGLGILTLSEQLAAEVVPLLRGYDNEPSSRSLLYSHVNYPGIYALHATLEFLREIGWSRIYARVDMLSGALAATLRSRGFDIVTPADAHAGIVAVRHGAALKMVRELAARSIYVEERDGLVRIAPHFYNTQPEISQFVAAFEALSSTVSEAR